MCGPHHCLGRGAFASGAEILRRLLQLRQNASILEQGCAGHSPNSANRKHQITRHPWRTSPPLRPSLSFRYTQEFDFLGYTFGRMFSERTGETRLAYRPSKKSIKRMVEKIHALTDRTGTWQETTKLVGKVNRTLRGWANYFQVGTVSKAYRALDSYAAMRLRRWLQFKHKTRRRKGGTYPLPHLYGHFGLVRLSGLGHDVPWVKA